MRTIKILDFLITLIFWALIVILFFGLGVVTFLFFFTGELPGTLAMYKQGLEMTKDYNFAIVPFSILFVFASFILGVYFLKKSIVPMRKGDFYDNAVIVNLAKSGKIFIFISLITIILKFTFQVLALHQVNNMIQGLNSVWTYLVAVVSSFSLNAIILLVIGLFFLLFSKVFENSKMLKNEYDLTI